MQMIEIIRMLQAITLRNRRLWKNAGNIESNINIKLIMTPIGNDIKKKISIISVPLKWDELNN